MIVDDKRLEFTLDRLVRQEVTDRIVKAQLEIIEKTIREQVSSILGNLEIEEMRRYNDMRSLVEHLHVSFRLSENR